MWLCAILVLTLYQKPKKSFTDAEIDMPESSFRVGDGIDVIENGKSMPLSLLDLAG